MKEQTISLDSISPSGILYQLKKNWCSILCLTIATLFGATGVGSLLYVPQYTTVATLVIRLKSNNSYDAYTSLAQTTQMSSVYSEVIQSDAVEDRLSEVIGTDIAGTITCTPIEETNLLDLKVSSSSPREAFVLIHAIIDNCDEMAGYVFSDATIEVLEEPSIPEKPSNIGIFIEYRILFASVTAVIASLLITLLYLFRNTVKVASKASTVLDGAILGVIPFEQKHIHGGYFGRKNRATASMTLSSSNVSMSFAEASRRVATRIEAYLQKKKFKVVLITSAVENEGKSTVAANIAMSLAERGKDVVLVDADLRNPTQWRIFSEQNIKRPSFSDVINKKASLREALKLNHHSGLWELFQFKPVKEPIEVINNPSVRRIFEILQKQMDYIIIDSAPVVAAADTEVLMHYADTTALIVRQDVSDVRAINDIVDLACKSSGDFSGFVLNGFRK